MKWDDSSSYRGSKVVACDDEDKELDGGARVCTIVGVVVHRK